MASTKCPASSATERGWPLGTDRFQKGEHVRPARQHTMKITSAAMNGTVHASERLRRVERHKA